MIALTDAEYDGLQARIAALIVDCNVMCNALQRIEAGEREPRMIARRTLEHWSEKAARATAETISNPRKEDDDDTDPMVPRPAG